jgi:adenylate cyclase
VSDVFISYARSTQSEAKQVAEALRAIGWSVWLDDELPAHRDYSEVIEEQLRAARAVVVVWSSESAKSQWVRAEADLAREAGKLVQLTVDRTPLPMPFNRIQCADLYGWAGDPAASGWKKIVQSVAELVGCPHPVLEAGQPRTTPALVPEEFLVAIAHFVDPNGVAAGDDFAEGLVAEVATALARFPMLRVVDPGPTSAARYLLEGSVRRSGPRARINVQLRDATKGERVWAERFDEGLEDAFAVQDNVATTVAGRVEAAILAYETRHIAGRPVESLSAHELWLRARATVRRAGLEQVDEIEALSERAVTLAPGHALSLSLLAVALGLRIAYAGGDANLSAFKTRLTQLIDRAMLAGADDPEVLACVAQAHLLSDGDKVAARAIVDRALKMNPGLVIGWDIAGNVRMWIGDYEEALAHYERSLLLDPQSPWRTYTWPSMAGCLVAMGRFEEAIPLAKEGLEIGPNNPWATAFLIAALVHLGRMQEAETALTRLDRRQAAVFESGVGFGPKLMGIVNEALKLAGWTVLANATEATVTSASPAPNQTSG